MSTLAQARRLSFVDVARCPPNPPKRSHEHEHEHEHEQGALRSDRSSANILAMLNKIRTTVKRWVIESREKRAGKIAKDAAGRATELYERGKTGTFL